MSPDPHNQPRHSDEECTRLLDRFLLPPDGLLAALAPEGWSNSPLLRCYHPTPDQCREEDAALRANLQRWSRLAAERRGAPVDEADADEDAERIEWDTPPVDPEREVVDLVGHVLWDVFSDNHTVFDAAGEFDLGSFRGAAGFLAEEINVRYRRLGGRRDYLDFYMGTSRVGRGVDLGPAYRWVFAGLRAAGCDWRYSFPRIYLVSFAHDPERADALAYDPSAAVAAELDAGERQHARAELQQRLDADHNDAVEQAKRRPPPAIVQAYYEVYGRWPAGWPPRREE